MTSGVRVPRQLIVTTVIIVILMATFALMLRLSDPHSRLGTPTLPDPSLKALAVKHNLQIGNFASLKYLRERPYRDILTSEFEYVMADGEPNWSFEDFELRPTRDDFDFRNLDQVFAFAREHNMPVRVQHLVWGEQKWLPGWLKEGNYSDEELLAILKDHITTVVDRYEGRVREYSVVNEAFSRQLKKGGNTDWWGERLGTRYIDQAFRSARAADPEAVLILNDFGNESMSDITELTYSYLEDALKRGVPIDAVGMQMHIDASSAASKEEVKATMQRYAKLGLKVYVTEFDVNMHNVHESRADEERLQADIYREMVKACLEVGVDVCPNFGFLGLIDRQSWYRGIGITDADPLMFTDGYRPKPAYFAVREGLER